MYKATQSWGQYKTINENCHYKCVFVWNLSPSTSFEEIASNLVWGIFAGVEFDSSGNFSISGLLLKIL